jgi:hypothetical protein
MFPFFSAVQIPVPKYAFHIKSRFRRQKALNNQWGGWEMPLKKITEIT